MLSLMLSYGVQCIRWLAPEENRRVINDCYVQNGLSAPCRLAQHAHNTQRSTHPVCLCSFRGHGGCGEHSKAPTCCRNILRRPATKNSHRSRSANLHEGSHYRTLSFEGHLSGFLVRRPSTHLGIRFLVPLRIWHSGTHMAQAVGIGHALGSTLPL